MGQNAIRFPVSVGRFLREKRKELRLTLDEVSQRLSSEGEPMHAATLSRVETGQADPGVRRLYLLLDLYRIPPHLVADLIELETMAERIPEPGSESLETLQRKGIEHFKKGNLAAAIGYYFAVRQHVSADDDDRTLRQQATLAFAVAARELGKYPLARQIVDDLLVEPPVPSIAANVLTLGASLWRGLGSLDVALGLLHRAEELLQPEQHKESAYVLHQKAKLLLEIGRTEEANKTLARALTLYRRVGDRHGEVRALVLRIAILEKSDLDKSLSCARRVLRLSEEHDIGGGVERAHIEIGRLLVQAGEPGAGLESLYVALGRATERGDRESEFRARYHLWKAYVSTGDTHRAAFELASARHVLQYLDERSPETDEVRTQSDGNTRRGK